MKNLRIPAVAIIMLLTGAIMAQDQKVPDSKPQKKKEQVSVVANNGKVLTAAGCEAFEFSTTDIISIRVRHDSLFYMLKEEALKKVDADPERNYKKTPAKQKTKKRPAMK